MGKRFRKALLSFIDDIPDSKLEDGLPINPGKCTWTDDNYRLDMQGITTAKDGKSASYNLHVQANKQALIASVKAAGKKGASVSKVEMPVAEPWTAAVIKGQLKAAALAFGKNSGQF